MMIISLSGPSGIGKGFVREQLLRAYPCIQELLWFTTRPLRLTEQQHSNRIHVSLSEFNKLAESGQLVLVQDLYGHRYGLKKEDLLPGPNVRLTELHPVNVEEALRINPEVLAIGFITSDFSMLRERLVLRKTESATEIEQRITSAQIEIETILRQKALFAAVIEVAKDSEVFVFGRVLTVLTPHLKKKEG
jgi:guanylate kinase